MEHADIEIKEAGCYAGLFFDTGLPQTFLIMCLPVLWPP
jgi:hypothetical protein